MASLVGGIRSDGHGYWAACHGSLVESAKNNAQIRVNTLYVL